ncbi:T9SS type A sorting domain-containing protein [Altibacter sp.]
MIDVSALASGVYVVEIASEQASVVKRLIKE